MGPEAVYVPLGVSISRSCIRAGEHIELQLAQSPVLPCWRVTGSRSGLQLYLGAWMGSRLHIYTRVAGAHGGGCRESAALRRRTGPDLSSHDGFYELHGTDLNSDAE